LKGKQHENVLRSKQMGGVYLEKINENGKVCERSFAMQNLSGAANNI
jgi:hypothetical protein